jgi:hypothetical protein
MQTFADGSFPPKMVSANRSILLLILLMAVPHGCLAFTACYSIGNNSLLTQLASFMGDDDSTFCNDDGRSGSLQSTTISTTATPTTSMHLLSLNCPSSQEGEDDGHNGPRSTSTTDSSRELELLEDVWRWKDVVLGDGRDFFAPHCKMLAILQSVIMLTSTDCSSNDSYIVTIQECSILSNCARLEIILVVSSRLRDEADIDAAAAAAAAAEARMIDSFTRVVSNCIADQVRAYKAPQELFPETEEDDVVPTYLYYDGRLLSNHWTHVQGMQHVCRRLCWIAAGIALKPIDPTNAPIEFRPFASQDSHITWQLKRTVEVAEGTTIQKVLQSALRAGKACRNVEKVPEIGLLEDAVLRTSWSKAADVDAAKAAVIHKVIEPAVQDYLDTMRASDRAKIIQQLRSTVMSWSQNDEEEKWLRKQLHGPTLESRTDVSFDLEIEMESIQRKLELGRREQK